MKIHLALPLLLILILGQLAVPQSKPPAVYRDRHICPGEGCDYRGSAVVKAPSAVFAAIGIGKVCSHLKRARGSGSWIVKCILERGVSW